MADALTSALTNEFDALDPAKPKATTTDPFAPQPQQAGTGIPAPSSTANGIPAPTAQPQAATTATPAATTTAAPATTAATPTATATTASAPSTVLDPNAAMNSASSAFQSALGRPMTAAEQQQLIAAIGLQPGQPVTQAHLDQALRLISEYAATQTPTAPAPAPVAPPPGAAPIDPNQALNTVNTTFQNLLGRPMSGAEYQQLLAAVGLEPGDVVTQADLDLATRLIQQYAAAQGGSAPAQPTPTPGTPGTPGPTEPTPQPGAPGGLDPNAALGTAQAAFEARFGRPMTAAEQQQLIDALGLQPGAPITQAQVDQALALIAGYNPAPATPGADPGATPGAPAAGIDPAAAATDISNQFKAKFGRVPTQEEMNWLISMAGYTSGNVTPEQMAAAVDALTRYTGNIAQPFDPVDTKTDAELAALEKLEELLGEEWGEVDELSPGFAGQKQANALVSQRAADRKRAALAERAAQRGGLNAGGFDVDTERILQMQGEQESAFESGLYERELTAQRERLLKGIELALQTGLQEDAQALQEKLAELDLALKDKLGTGQLGLGLLEALLGNQNYNDRLGFDYASLANLMNTQAINSMFG